MKANKKFNNIINNTNIYKVVKFATISMDLNLRKQRDESGYKK